MNNNYPENDIDMLLNSAEWHRKEFRKLLDEYKACRTENARIKLIPKLKHIDAKAEFELKEIRKLMGDEEDWKNGGKHD